MELEGPIEWLNGLENRKVPRILRVLEFKGDITSARTAGVRVLILWLEEHWIRFYSPEKRGFLRQGATDPNTWNHYCSNVLNTYLSDLQYPSTGSLDTETEVLHAIYWLFSTAVAMKYHDQSPEFNSAGKLSILNSVPSNDTARNMSFSSQYKDKLFELADAVNIPRSENLLHLIRAIRRRIGTIIFASQVEENKEQVETLENCQMGISVPDKLKKIIGVLRLSYINDMKDLQIQINNAISELQQFTANPQTDAKLGKVGS